MIYNKKSLYQALYQVGWEIDTNDDSQVRAAQALLRKDRYEMEPEGKLAER